MTYEGRDAPEHWLKPIETRRVPWHRRLDVRLALVTGGLVFVAGITVPILRQSVCLSLIHI